MRLHLSYKGLTIYKVSITIYGCNITRDFFRDRVGVLCTGKRRKANVKRMAYDDGGVRVGNARCNWRPRKNLVTPKNDLGFPSFLPYTYMCCTSESAMNELATSTRSPYCVHATSTFQSHQKIMKKIINYSFFLLKRFLSVI